MRPILFGNGLISERGVLSPELTCSWYNNFFGDEHIHVFYIRAKFRDEMTFLLICVKKTNPVTKMRFKKYVFRAVILSFLQKKA